jgi:hypothetical protein
MVKERRVILEIQKRIELYDDASIKFSEKSADNDEGPPRIHLGSKKSKQYVEDFQSHRPLSNPAFKDFATKLMKFLNSNHVAARKLNLTDVKIMKVRFLLCIQQVRTDKSP